MNAVRIRVPATTANMGPGFDTLGCAFALYNFFTFERAEKTEIIGCPACFSGEDNLALVAFRAAEKRAGRAPTPVKITVETYVPSAGGLGTSATFLVGGVIGANALLGLGLDIDVLLSLVTELEGHPDNVAPALLGGFTAVTMEGDLPLVASLPIDPVFRFCAFVPDFRTDTHTARKVLPEQVTRADAVFNTAHALLLVNALRTGDAALLSRAMQDRLHQPYRRVLIHDYDAVEAAALACGAHAFFLSGSGSTCMAIYTQDDFPAAMEKELAALPHNWQTFPLIPDRDGACQVI